MAESARNQSIRQQHHSVFHPEIHIHYTTAGQQVQEPTSSGRCDFSGNYRSNMDTCWTSTRTCRRDPPQMIQGSEIHTKCLGQLPGYMGHVPGDITRYGKTYGYDTKDAKKYMREFNPKIDCYYSTFGRTNLKETNIMRQEFTQVYRSKLSHEWTPPLKLQANPPLIIQTPPIYYTHVGLVPHYGGHVPGEIFRYGKTYGADTKDAKAWLREVSMLRNI